MVSAANDSTFIPAWLKSLWLRLDDRERDQYHAYILRLKNRDPMAERLTDMVLAGQISFRQMLSRMERPPARPDAEALTRRATFDAIES